LAGAGVPLAEQYKSAGLDLMFNHAQFEDGTLSVEAGLMEMADRMRGDRWKVFKGQNDSWLEEYRLYHRDVDGRVVKENDDAISASRYGMMMRRFGRAGDWDFNRPINYPKLGIVGASICTTILGITRHRGRLLRSDRWQGRGDGPPGSPDWQRRGEARR